MTAHSPKSDTSGTAASAVSLEAEADDALRDIGDVPAVEVVTTVALHLMSAAAVKVGLGSGPSGPGTAAGDVDLDEARTLITALAGLVTAGAPDSAPFTQHHCGTASRPCNWPSARPHRFPMPLVPDPARI